MQLQDLQYAPTHTLAASQTVYRVQRRRSRVGTVVVGALRLPPASAANARFSLAAELSGYFAESPLTACYESLVRREATALSLADAAQRQLLCLRCMQPLQLLDLRPHAGTWPVLQSLRFGATQALAAGAHAAGYDGIAYRSAQQYGQDCFVVFGAGLAGFRLVWRKPLLHASGGIHQALAAAARGGQIAVTP